MKDSKNTAGAGVSGAKKLLIFRVIFLDANVFNFKHIKD